MPSKRVEEIVNKVIKDLDFVYLEDYDVDLKNWLTTTLSKFEDEIRRDEREGEKMVCNECGKSDRTVADRICGYSQEIHGTDNWERVCDACEHEHLMDI